MNPVAAREPAAKTCSCGRRIMANGECAACNARRTLATAGPAQRPAIGVPGQGLPLDPGTRAEMRDRFAEDFSHVRVHIDQAAANSARAANALAYTFGNHVVFGDREYNPQSARGPGVARS